MSTSRKFGRRPRKFPPKVSASRISSLSDVLKLEARRLLDFNLDVVQDRLIYRTLIRLSSNLKKEKSS